MRFQSGLCFLLIAVSLVLAPRVSATTIPAQYDVTIRYSESKTTMILTNGYGPIVPTGYNIFLIVTFQIQSHADQEFYTNPNNFYVIGNNVKYGYSSNSFLVSGMLPTVDLLKGGSVSGKLVFEVPSGSIIYTPTYDWITDFQIEWIAG